jgi:hypothetical protein
MISVVYHCYLVGDWKSLVSQQLGRLKESGLYDSADNIYVTVNVGNSTEDEFKSHVSEYSKLQIEFHEHNSAEYPGIKKVRDIATTNDTKIFYFHTKGVSNTYKDYNTKEYSSEKVENIKSWKECLEYFLIDKWSECIDKLDNFDNVGVTCNGGWFWGNFWWSKSSHIQKTAEVGHWGRWDYEAWLNRDTPNSLNFEWFHFNYNPYVTNISEDWYKTESPYKDELIVVRNAKYGSISFEVDEGHSGSKLNITNNVTDIVRQNVVENNHRMINIRVDNDVLGGDPVFGSRKFLVVELSPRTDMNKIYKIGIHEGQVLKFAFYKSNDF